MTHLSSSKDALRKSDMRWAQHPLQPNWLAYAAEPAAVGWVRVSLVPVATKALTLVSFQVAPSAWVPGQLIQTWQVSLSCSR